MLVSGLFSIVVIGMLFANTMHYVQNVTVADRAVKICRINVNSSARNIREMALNNDTSSYDGYEQTVERLLAEVNTQLKNLKNSGVIPDADCEEYASALTDWGNIGYSIINFIDITPRFLPVFAEKFSFEYLRKSHKIPLFSNKLVTLGYCLFRTRSETKPVYFTPLYVT